VRRVGLAVAGALALASAQTAPAAAQPAAPPPPGSARLVGVFSVAGRVTVAHDVKGERVGQRATRLWSFTPLCEAGACPTVELIRRRAHGADTLTLFLIGPGSYQGRGLFYAPLRCAGRRYTKGESVPFTITVHVTGAVLISGVDVASTVTARYVNTVRRNRTRCVDIPGHDAAVYSGRLVAPPSGGAPAVSDRWLGRS
jgi:hypothetical protein